MAFGQQEPGKKLLLGPQMHRAILRLLRKNDIPLPGSDDTDSNLITGVNVGLTNLDAYHAVEVGDPYFTDRDDDEFHNSDWFNIALMTANTERVGITQEPIEDPGTGSVILSGVTQVRADISDLSHTHLVVANSATMTSAASGPLRLLDTPTALGENLYKVMFEGSSPSSVKATAEWDFNNTDLGGGTGITNFVSSDLSKFSQSGSLLTSTTVPCIIMITGSYTFTPKSNKYTTIQNSQSGIWEAINSPVILNIGMDGEQQTPEFFSPDLFRPLSASAAVPTTIGIAATAYADGAGITANLKASCTHEPNLLASYRQTQSQTLHVSVVEV